jgi:hypothetical protein
MIGIRCSSINTASGGGSEGGNPVVTGKLYTSDTHPAAGAVVRFIPSGHDPRDTIKIDTAVTGSDGVYKSDSIASGYYNVLAKHSGDMAFIDSIHVTGSGALAPSATLTTPGSKVCRIALSAGQSASSVLVILIGTDVVATPDSSGKVILPLLAAGSYTVRIVSSSDSIQKKDTTFTISQGLTDTVAQTILVPDPTLPSHFALAADSALFGMRKGFGAVVFGGKMWVIGGSDNTRNFNDVWNSSDGAVWTKVTGNAGFSNRNQLSAVIFNNSIWVLGGMGDSGRVLCDVWHSTDGISWTSAIDSTSCLSRYGFAAAVFNGKMWVMAGYGVGGYMSDVWSSADGISWTKAVDIPGYLGRFAPQALVFDKKIWLTGGRTSTADMADVWSSPDGVNWTCATAAAAFPPRSSFGAAAAGTIMVVSGGTISATFTAGNDAWYSYDGITWVQFQTPAAFPAMSNHASLYLNNKIWIIGQVADADRSNVWSLY